MAISKDLKWNTHVSNVCTKANRTLGFLRCNLSSCPQDVKEMAYKGLVRPILEYASPVWDPHGLVVQEELEKVQNRAARLVTGNYKIGEERTNLSVFRTFVRFVFVWFCRFPLRFLLVSGKDWGL